MNNIFYGLLATLFTFAMTALGSGSVFFLRRGLSPRFAALIPALAAGVMTAASVWSLLLPAIDQATRESLFPGWFPAAIGLTAGMAFLLGLDVYMPPSLLHSAGGRSNALLLSSLTLHNIPEGMAVGLSFALATDEAGLYQAAALALGIGIQNLPEGAAIALPLHQGGLTKRAAFARGALSGAVEPLFGVAVMFLAGIFHPVMPYLLSFAAGAMLCATITELLPQARGRWGTLGFFAGFLVMMILDVALS